MTAREKLDEAIRDAIKEYEEETGLDFLSCYIRVHRPAGFQAAEEIIVEVFSQ